MSDETMTKEEFLEKDRRPSIPYAVLAGDTLRSLAKRFYRNEVFAPCIAKFNRILGKDPQIQEGQELKLPTVVFIHKAGDKAYSADFAPEGPIQIGLFFDGTNNSMLFDSQEAEDRKPSESNVAKLFYLYPQDGEKIFKAYIRGVGTDGFGPQKMLGSGFGWHFEAKIALAMLYLKERVKTNAYTKYVIDVFGFSRGAAEARHFLTCLWRPEFQDLLGVFADHLEVRFVGIFDTVAAVGTGPFGFDAGRALALQPQMAKRVVHLVAQTEVRINFDLRSLRLPPGAKSTRVGALEKARRSLNGVSFDELAKSPPLPEGWEERIFPGVHSDVGGGYSDRYHRPDFPQLYPSRGESSVQYHRRVIDFELERGGQPHPTLMSDPPEKKRIQEDRVFEKCQAHAREYQAYMSDLLATDPLCQVEREKYSLVQNPMQIQEVRAKKWELWKPCSRYLDFQQCPKLRDPNASLDACPVVERKATLSRLPLQYMIHQAMEAGVPLTPPSKANNTIRSRIEIPSESGLEYFANLMYDPQAFEKAIQPSEEAYRTKVVPLMHDSLWIVDGPGLARESSYFREVFYNISMEDGYRYSMPDVLPDAPTAIPEWAKPVLHGLVRNLKGGIAPVHQIVARYIGLIPPTNPEAHDDELSEDDEIVERFDPLTGIQDAEIFAVRDGAFIGHDFYFKSIEQKRAK